MPLPAPETAGGTLDTSIDELARSFDQAAQAAELLERSIRIGDAHVRLRFAGVTLAEQLGRAFDHLAHQEDDEPNLTIHVWDAEGSGTPPPPLPSLAPGSPRSGSPPPRFARSSTGGFRTAGHCSSTRQRWAGRKAACSSSAPAARGSQPPPSHV